MATTTNYGWATPDDTDLVKDGAAAIRTLGSSADTTVKNLSPGTTAGDLDYYTSGTAKARLGIGTAGQVLQVNTGATAPEWAAPAAGGGLELIASVTAGAYAGIDFTSIDSSYKELYIQWNGIYTGSSTGWDIRFNANSGTVYRSGLINGSATTASADVVQNGTSIYPSGYFVLFHANSTDYNNNGAGYVRIFDANSTSYYKTYEGKSSYYNNPAAAFKNYFVNGMFMSTSRITEINIVRTNASNNLTVQTNGIVNLWGLK